MSRSELRTTMYLETPHDTERFIASLAGVRAIAIDTEGASFHRFVDRIYLLQLATDETIAIIDPLTAGVPEGLGKLLEDPAVEVVFHDADYDLRLLHQDYGWHVARIFDTRLAAQLLGIRALGLAALLDQFFGVKLNKKFQRADWSMRPLPQEMLDYAAQDTMHLLELRDRLRAELERAGRWAWAEEEFRALEGTRWANSTDGEDAYRKIKGARDLTRRELALFRELVRWRDDVARALDRATFRVASNDALFELARSAPRTLDELLATRGVPRALAERRGDHILAAVRQGAAIPDDQLPRFPRPPRWERDPNFDERVARLRSVRDAAAQRLGLDPGFLCSRDRLELVARGRPHSLEALAGVAGLRRWQIAELGNDFLRALEAN